MTSSEDFSPEAKHLLRQAKGGDRATRSEVASAVERFRNGQAQRPAWQPRVARSSTRRATQWAVFATILSGTLGAYATVGQSLGLPVPGWWPEFTSLPAFSDATANRSPGAAGRSDESATASSIPPAPGITTFETPESGIPAVASVGPTTTLPAAADVSERRVPAQSPARASDERTYQVNASARAVAPSTTPTSPNTTTAPAGSLAQEVQTITAARDALNAGNCAMATHHLETHRLQFPKGALGEERQALSAICQCRQGQGTSAAATYVARRSGSPLARRVATECSLDSPE